MEAEVFIDYLQYSINYRKTPAGNKSIKPIRNYKTATQNFDGGRTYYGNILTPEKALVIYSGNPLVMMRKNGLPTLDFIEQIIEAGGKISRIDMTVDFYVGDDFLTPNDFVEFWQNGIIESSHAEFEPKFYGTVTSDGTFLETLNFGDVSKRAKRGMVRVYDTGLTQNLDRYMITRVEVEDKREKAHSSAVRCIDYGIASVLPTRFNVAHPTWIKGIGSSIAPTHRGAKKETDKDDMTSRWEWLLTQVAPALKDAIVHDLSYERYDRIEEFLNFIDPYEEIL